MDYINNLLEERNKAVMAGREILDRAAAESRNLSAEEQQAFDRTEADIVAKGQMIEALRKQDAVEAEQRAAVADHVEARAETIAPAVERSDDDLIRSLARGEMRSVNFEKRDVTKASTGAPVPTSFYDQVMTLARYTGPMLEVATIINTASGENLQIPRTNAYSTGSVSSEGVAIGESDPTFQSFLTLGAFKYSFLVQVSNEMIEDSGVDILGYLGTNVGQALGLAVNAGLTTGTGTVEPNGIVAAAGSGITGGTGVGGAFTTDNVIDLAYSLNAAARRLPGFGIMGSTSAVATLRKLQDGGGQYVWQPSLIAGQPDTVLGYPVYENPSMAAVGTSAKSLIAGHFPTYLVRQVGGIRLDRSDDFAFSSGLVTFRATYRVDGGLPQATHVKYFVGGTA